MTDTSRRKALIVLSSARRLPLSEPADHPGISTGFFLVELAAVMAAFEDTNEFILATPDGEVPQLDINGLALNFHAGASLGPATARTAVQTYAERFSPEKLREKNPDLVEAPRRTSSPSPSAPWPASRSPSRCPRRTPRLSPSAASSSPASRPCRSRRTTPSSSCIERHRDSASDFSLADLDFVHMPGGHAPMVDFNDNPWMGELLHTLREADVPISLICHAPVALTSARYRVDGDGNVTTDDDHAFKGAHITTVPKYGETVMLASSTRRCPASARACTYYVDVALKEAGYDVSLTLNPSAAKVVWDAGHSLLTGNGPQAVDEQAARLAEIVRGRTRALSGTRA